MRKAEKARRIGRILDELLPEPGVPLAHRDPFSLLVAVVLSAQTTDAQVNRVTPLLLARAPDPARLAALAERDILAIIRPLGLAPTKARHLRAMARLLGERFEGGVPRELEDLESLPGVGHKTASVVRVQAFGLPAFPVDTHIHRLAARWGLSDGSRVERTERDLKAVFPEAEWGRRHLQLILFGRRYCPARGHRLEACPICSWAARRTRAKEARP